VLDFIGPKHVVVVHNKIEHEKHLLRTVVLIKVLSFSILLKFLIRVITAVSVFVLAEKMKPCVTHRDLNSRNILVKADLSCCLCDLGFAMKISGSKYFHNGEEQHAETKSINDVSRMVQFLKNAVFWDLGLL
jgi:serine/threonine protein kinase